MADFYLKSGAGAVEYSDKVWSAGEKMVPARADASSNVAVAKRWVWECTTGGTSSATPTWPASVTQDVTTVTNNGVVWTARKPGYSSGSTADWSFAAIYMDYVIGAMAAGDRLFISNNHSQTIDSNVSFDFPGTLASPNEILCVSDLSAPPTALADTAYINTTNGSQITLNGSFNMYGVTLDSGSGPNNSYIYQCYSDSNHAQLYENCIFRLGGSASGPHYVRFGNTINTARQRRVIWKNCKFRCNHTNSKIFTGQAAFKWDGGSIVEGSATPTSLFSTMVNALWNGSMEIDGVDFRNYGTSFNIFDAGGIEGGLIRNCAFPTSWSGSLANGAFSGPRCRIKMHNCDSGDTNYRMQEEDFAGSVRSETTITRTGGASDGTTPLSWKMASNANARHPLVPLESPEIALWNETIGSSVTITVEIVHDSQGSGTAGALQNDEIGLELQILGTSGVPLGSFISTALQTTLTTPSDITSSSETWTTTRINKSCKTKNFYNCYSTRKGCYFSKGCFV